MKDQLFELITLVSGQPYNPLWEEKLPFILNGLVFVAIFVILFFYFYHKYFWQEKTSRKLFFFTLSTVVFLIVAKYVLYHFYQGYVSDRLFFYALPSPRAKNFIWFLLPCIIFILFLFFQQKIEKLPKNKFLAVISLFFIIFTLSVAGIRDGLFSIIDPLTRSYWEYTGSLPLVQEMGVKNFISQFSSILSQLPIHTQTHPPGYVLFLFFWQNLLLVGYLGLAVILVIIASLTVLPLYYLWEKVISPVTARKMVEVFIFIPSLVIFSATSMEAFFILIVWLAIVLCFFGWKKNLWLSLIGGLVLAYALFSNFLFLLLTPFFLALFVYILKTTNSGRTKIIARAVFSGIVCLFFFIILKYWGGYSVVDNFFVARDINKQLVESNFVSVGIYFQYLAMNILAFLTYLGVPLCIIFFSDLPCTFKKSGFWFKAGVGILFFFLLVGIFQGEIERIWLFIVPFFIPFFSHLYSKYNSTQFRAVLSLLFFQIIIFSVLFYTYW